MQSKAMVRVFVGDVLKKILVRRDAERRRPISPFDSKSAIGFNFREIGDRSRVGNDVAVSHNAAEAAAGQSQDRAGEQSDRSLIHNSTLAGETGRPTGLDSRIRGYQSIAFDLKFLVVDHFAGLPDFN